MVVALALAPPAAAQAVSAVPPGVTAITVMVCDRADGCERPYVAMADHCAALGIPLLDFDAVASAGPGGGDARAALDQALAAVEKDPTRTTLEAARRAIQATPLTLPGDTPFRIWILLASARLSAQDQAGADEAFAAAASSSGHRVYDLPALPADALERYLDIAGRHAPPATLTITADHPGATALVDGRPVGAPPVSVPVAPGWHRVSVERPGRRTAWVGEVVLPAGQSVGVDVEIAADDASAALEAAVSGAIRGQAAPVDVAERLATWAATQGLSTVRFVAVTPVDEGGAVPEERIPGKQGDYEVYAVWLDVSRARFEPRGPGPATLRSAAATDRHTLGLGVGYTRLQQTLATGPDPHDQLHIELVGVVRVRPWLGVDARLGLWHSAQPYYLYDDWTGHNVYPVALGARWTPGESPFYAGTHALVIVPFALGGEVYTGLEWRPTPHWRLGIEARGGYTDQGPLVGGGVSVGYAE